jgi:RNA polymerase sigma-B factor
LADLDAIAEDYDRRRADCPGPVARRLRDDLITEMVPLADRIARRYRNCGEPPADLTQVARLGLVKAVDRYDAQRGSFTAFAVLTIVGEIKRYFRDQTWGVRVPRRLQELAREVSHAEATLSGELCRRPSDAEVAARCLVETDAVNEARISHAGYRPVPLSTPIGDSGRQLGETFGEPDPAIDLATDRITARDLVQKLPAREQRILDMRFNHDLTQAQMADELGLSQMHVSRLLARALLWLREGMLNNTEPRWPGADPESGDDRLSVDVRIRRGRSVHVRAAGEADRDNAQYLRSVLLDAVRCAGRHQTVTLELSGLSMLDSAGVAALLAVHELARTRGVRVQAVGLTPFVRRIAEISGLGALLPDQDRAYAARCPSAAAWENAPRVTRPRGGVFMTATSDAERRQRSADVD